MQQYRINYVLLIVLVVGTLVFSGAGYALWRFQIERNADTLLVAAQEAEEEGKPRSAIQYYGNYLWVRPGDDEVREKFAHAYADLTDADDVTFEELGLSLKVLENSVRKLPSAKSLQKRLVELYARFNRLQDAIDHLGYMLEKYPDDTELKTLRLQYLSRSGSFDEAIEYASKLIGYDPDSETFDVEQAPAADDPMVYGILANLLRTKRTEDDVVDRVINMLIEVNPESAAAYLERARYYYSINEPDKARSDLEKAYQLDSEDADVLLAIADQARKDELYDKAREYLESGKSLFADDTRFYQGLAGLEMAQKDYEAAMAHVDEGLEKVAGRHTQLLLAYKADLQVVAQDFEGLDETVQAMREAGFRTEYVAWVEARKLLSQGHWYEAATILSELRPRITAFRDMQIQVEIQLGLCYERLGQAELALTSYRLVLQQDPLNVFAEDGEERVTNSLGRQPVSSRNQTWQQIIDAELAKPKGEQNWEEIERLVAKIADRRELGEADRKLIMANILAMREDYSGARKLLREANSLESDNLRIYRALVSVARRDPSQGPTAAMRTLEEVVRRFGDRPELRLDKAELLIAMKAERLADQLAELSIVSDEWTDSQKVEFWNGMAARYASMGMRDEAIEHWALVAEARPDNLPTRLMLFTLAFDANDDAGMREAQDMILDVVKDTNDGTWVYTEARRLLSLVRRNRLGNETLDEIRSLIDRAMQQRPDWHDLYLVRAELELLAGNPNVALVNYEQADKLGRPYPSAVLQHMRLLVRKERFLDAKRLAEQLPEAIRERRAGQAYTEILIRTGDYEDAIESAKAVIEADPENYAKQLWFGRVLARAVDSGQLTGERRRALLDQVGPAFRRTVELNPESADGWMALVTYHVIRREKDQAADVLRQARLALSTDRLIPVLARSYEIMGLWLDAENLHLTTYELDPSDSQRAHPLAMFYLGNVYKRDDKLEKAVPLINQILRAGAEGEIESSDPALLWARRTAADMLSERGDYRSLLKAEQLLASNSIDGSLSMEDRLRMALILAPRPEPVSRLKAVKLLEEVSQAQRLDMLPGMRLGVLYYSLGEWAKCRRQMLQTIGRFPERPEPRDNYARMLLARGSEREVTEAATQVKRLREIAPGQRGTIELYARVLNRTGKLDQARAELLGLLPGVQKTEGRPEEQRPLIELVAFLLEEIGELDASERVFRLLVSQDPTYRFQLAHFMGRHHGADLCFAMLEEAYDFDMIPTLVDVANRVLRANRDEVGSKYDQMVQRWIDRAMLEDPDSITLLSVQAEFYELQKAYDEAIDIYQRLLDNPGLTGNLRAVVLNNLCFLLSLSGSSSSGADPLELIEEAIYILGPTTDILDTRAVVYISRQKYQEAIRDLDLALINAPTAAKYYHKAVAHLLAGENSAALSAWEKAEELGLSLDDLNRMEYDQFETMKAKIDALRARSAFIGDGVHVAGG